MNQINMPRKIHIYEFKENLYAELLCIIGEKELNNMSFGC